MRKALLFLALISVSIALHAQIKDADTVMLARFLTERVNKLRVSLDKLPLKGDTDLAKAAALHSVYISKKNKLNHTQIGTKFPKPSDRVAHFTKEFTDVGENILYSKPVKLPLKESTLKKLAFDMFRSWKNSPGHYANMISDDFNHSGFGFAYNPKSRRVFATQVFAKKGYVIPGQLTNNAFSIKESDNSCVDLVGNTTNLIVNIGNAVHIENGEVFFKYHNLSILNEAIKNSKDGLAVDLVQRTQLICQEDNKLDTSPIYEGVMLKPIFRDELFANNMAQNKNRLIVSLGKIPESLRGKPLSPNLIYIKEGRKCGYTVPAQIPSKKYDLKPVAPIVFKPETTLLTEGINTISEVSFDFKSGKSTPVQSPVISFELNNIHAIDIKSFTSVDGTQKSNEKLHNLRANFIKRYLFKKGVDSNTPISVDAKENWALCKYQLELLGFDKDIISHSEIRAYVSQNNNAFWINALQAQRASKAIVYQYGTWLETDPNFLNYNLTDALLTKNYDRANTTLARMYESNTVDLFLNEEFIIDKLFDKKELVQNVAALLLKDIQEYDLDNIVFFVRTWLSQPEKLSEAAQKNLLNLYNITSRQLLKYWDSSTEDFSKVLHPNKVEPLFNNYKSSDVVNPIFLNFHMTSIDYYGQINFSPKIETSFNFITDYFRQEALNIDDDIALSLFFNRWSRYDLSIELLGKRFAKDTLNEEASFIFAKSYAAYNTDTRALFEIYKTTLKFNQERWCRWIDKDFQNLRNERVKNLFCNTCKK